MFDGGAADFGFRDFLATGAADAVAASSAARWWLKTRRRLGLENRNDSEKNRIGSKLQKQLLSLYSFLIGPLIFSMRLDSSTLSFEEYEKTNILRSSFVAKISK